MFPAIRKTAVRNKAGLLLIGAFLALPAVRAEEAPSIRRSITIKPVTGYQSGWLFGTLEPAPNTADVPPIDILMEPSGPSWGLGFGYRISRHFELEAEFLYSPARIMTDIGIGITGIPLGKTKASDAKSFSWTGHILYYPWDRILTPYISAGMGALNLNTDRFESKTRFFFSMGAGLKIKLASRLSAVIDLRDNLTFFRFIQDFKYYFPMIYNADFKTTQHSFRLLVGLGYSF